MSVQGRPLCSGALDTVIATEAMRMLPDRLPSCPGMVVSCCLVQEGGVMLWVIDGMGFFEMLGEGKRLQFSFFLIKIRRFLCKFVA